MASIAVFSGSKSGKDVAYEMQARKLGQEFAKRGIRLICGGGATGLMKVVAEAVLENGGTVSAIVPSEMNAQEPVNDKITCIRIVATVEERKKVFQESADAFIILPGGIGVMDEFFTVYSQAKLGGHRKPIGILNIENFFASICSLLENMIEQEFMNAKYLSLLLIKQDATTLLDAISDFRSTIS